MTFTWCVDVVTTPLLSMIVSVTVNVPVRPYVCFTDAPVVTCGSAGTAHSGLSAGCLWSPCAAYRGGVPTTYHRRPAPCTHCGDVVLVVESQVGKLFGFNLRRAPKIRLEHADAGPGGETSDPVDDGCRRPRVTG